MLGGRGGHSDHVTAVTANHSDRRAPDRKYASGAFRYPPVSVLGVQREERCLHRAAYTRPPCVNAYGQWEQVKLGFCFFYKCNQCKWVHVT